jgi:hypothetical protein
LKGLSRGLRTDASGLFVGRSRGNLETAVLSVK